MGKSEIEQILNTCLDALFDQDWALLEHDVSERAITHKLAEYLQYRIPHLNVDCEYNRNFEFGTFASKTISVLNYNTKEQIKQILDADITDLITISTFPDIIVHRRMRNDENLLVVEVKKRNSQVNHKHDYAKLKAFTESSKYNAYHFSYGVFLLLNTGRNWKSIKPELRWFVEGKEESP